MKRIVFSVTLLAGLLIFSGAAYAAVMTPAEKLAEITGKPAEDLRIEKGDRTWGALAQDAGYLEQFKKEMLEMKKEVIADRVTEGKLTQEQADTITQAMIEKQAACDGTGYAGTPPRYGVGFGQSQKQQLGKKTDQSLNRNMQMKPVAQ